MPVATGEPATVEEIARAPKALLHDHLDGGLRPATIVELAAEIGHELPASDARRLGAGSSRPADSGSLERYLETFAHTVARDADRRRAAPGGPRVRAGPRRRRRRLRRGPLRARAAPRRRADAGRRWSRRCRPASTRGSARRGRPIRVAPAAHRDAPRGPVAGDRRAAVRYRDAGVVGFDIAGAEAGYPPTRHLDAFEYLQRENFHFTIHAGEAFGLPSIWQAIQWCGADRLGHGVRIVDDITVDGDGAAELGRLAAYVRDKRIPLELCPSSNVQTGAAASIAEHPIGLLRELRFRVTVNTDNRLMSGTSMSREMALLVEAFGYGWADLQWFTINAMKSAFIPFDERLAIINVIKPGYAVLGAMQLRDASSVGAAWLRSRWSSRVRRDPPRLIGSGTAGPSRSCGAGRTERRPATPVGRE